MNKAEFKGVWINYNDRANLHLFGPEVDWRTGDEKTIERSNGDVFRLTAHKAGSLTVYTFGLMCKDPKERPGHGGEWSSNSDTINEMFGVDIRECGYNGISCAIDINDMKAFAPAGVYYAGLSQLGFHEFKMDQTKRMEKIDLDGILYHAEENYPEPIYGFPPKS